MANRSSKARRSWLNPKLILFGVAVFNFVLIWHAAHTMPGAGVVCPWFFPWSYFNAPTLLLAATVALLSGRKWTYVIAIGLPGYLLGDLIYRFWYYNLSIVDNVRSFFSPYEETVYAWHTQYLFALLVFTTAMFYLRRPDFTSFSGTHG